MPTTSHQFKEYAREVTTHVMETPRRRGQTARTLSLPELQPDRQGQAARAISDQHRWTKAWFVSSADRDCWTFDVNTPKSALKVQGERGRCSFLYHYYQHPPFGWLFVRLQTWFPFEIQVSQWPRMAGAANGPRGAERIAAVTTSSSGWGIGTGAGVVDQQLATSWPTELDALQRRSIPCIRNIWASSPCRTTGRPFKANGPRTSPSAAAGGVGAMV